MIIDYTYFIGKITLPQVADTNGRNDVTEAISIYEPEYLKYVLGEDLWKAFTDGIDGSGTPDQRWTDLLDGKMFTYAGRSYLWIGFKSASQPKLSPIANYVYWKFMQDTAVSNATIGTVVPRTENSETVTPFSKMVYAWNDMVDWDLTLGMFLNSNKDIYPEWNPSQMYYSSYYYGLTNNGGVFKKQNVLGI